MILIANPSHDTDTAIDILFRSTTDRLASHCRSRAVPGSDLNWKRLLARFESRAGVGTVSISQELHHGAVITVMPRSSALYQARGYPEKQGRPDLIVLSKSL